MRILIVIGLLAAMVAPAQTSETSKRLQQALKKHPQADADGDGVLTMTEARVFLREQRERQPGKGTPAVTPPTHPDVVYGPHARHRFDLWLVASDKPTPLVIYIHGGGFRGGDKSKLHRDSRLIGRFHAAGISVASVNYRLTENGKHPYPAPMHDGARAVQYLRQHAVTFNLDKARFAAMGGSAGGCMSMWLAMHEDLADPAAEDPLRRESTRLVAAAPSAGQSSLHPGTLYQWFGVESLTEHPALRSFYGLPLEGELQWSDAVDKLALGASPITHLTADDPPVFAAYGRSAAVTADSPPGLWVHHPIMGLKLKEKMDVLGIECHVAIGGRPVGGYRDAIDFLIKKLAP